MRTSKDRTAIDLAEWVMDLAPTGADLELAQRALVDTVAVALAAKDDPIRRVVAGMPDAGRWSALAHVLDFDDLHLASTTHISAVCVPAVLASGGDARAFLAGAGVMARLGVALGWRHYTSGWHATCTTGAPAAAVAAAVSRGLGPEEIATAIALALPAAGGVHRAFGTQAKPLQVGFATDAGIRAASLAAMGATADPSALEQWFDLVGGDVGAVDLGGPAVPGGLAVKLAPCCYAMQRPIHAARGLLDAGLDPAEVVSLTVRTPAATVHPLIHHRPKTGLAAKFSLEYAIAATLLDPFPGFDAFSTAAVTRPEAMRLIDCVRVEASVGGEGVLAGVLEVTAHRADGSRVEASATVPPGAPSRPATAREFGSKLEDCWPGRAEQLAELSWIGARDLMDSQLSVAGSVLAGCAG